MQVNELANDLKVGADVLIHLLRGMGIPVHDAADTITDGQVAKVVARVERERRAGHKAPGEAIQAALPVAGILVGVGMFIQIMTLTGVRGFFVVSALALPEWLLYIGIATSMPIFGAVSSFGSATVLGVPFLLALLGRDEIVVGSALSLMAGLGDLMPPTALAGLFAAQIVGVKNYFSVLKVCLLPCVMLPNAN